MLPPRAALTLAMVFHELVTNAAKYGALSQPEGMLEVKWTIEPGGENDALRLSWRESGGPAVIPPARRGFGTQMVERSIPAELGGTAALQFESCGVTCTLRFPLAKIRERNSRRSQRRARVHRRG
jgi:two-component sensor histidine kinase